MAGRQARRGRGARTRRAGGQDEPARHRGDDPRAGRDLSAGRHHDTARRSRRRDARRAPSDARPASRSDQNNVLASQRRAFAKRVLHSPRTLSSHVRYPHHRRACNFSQASDQSALVDHANLVTQRHRVAMQAAIASANLETERKARPAQVARERNNDHRPEEVVERIDLEDQYRAGTSLFRTEELGRVRPTTPRLASSTVCSIQLTAVLCDALFGKCEVLLGKLTIKSYDLWIIEHPLETGRIDRRSQRTKLPVRGSRARAKSIHSAASTSGRSTSPSCASCSCEVAQLSKRMRIGLLLVGQETAAGNVSTEVDELPTGNV